MQCRLAAATAAIVCSSLPYGLYSHALYTHGLYSYGLYSHALSSHGLYSYGLSSHGLYRYGLSSYGSTAPWLAHRCLNVRDSFGHIIRYA